MCQGQPPHLAGNVVGTGGGDSGKGNYGPVVEGLGCWAETLSCRPWESWTVCVCETAEVCGGAMLEVVCGVPHCFMCPGSSQTSFPLTPHSTEAFLELQGPGQWLELVLGELLFALPSPSISQPFKAPVCCQERILHEAPEVVH